MTSDPGGTRLWNRTRNRVVAGRLFRARNLWQLAAGLLERPPLNPGEALWLEPCGSIHTWGMRYPIDVVFLDRDLRVLGIARSVQPWRVASAPKGTRSALEFLAGEASGVEIGDQLGMERPTGSYDS